VLPSHWLFYLGCVRRHVDRLVCDRLVVTRRRLIAATFVGLAGLGMLAAAYSFVHRPVSVTRSVATPSSEGIQVAQPPCDPGPRTLVVRPDANRMVLRSFSGTNDRPAFALVATAAVIDHAALATLIRGLDNLLPYPCGTVVCPPDDGSRYQLDFNYMDGSSEELTLNEGGCRAVYFRGKSSPVATALLAAQLLSMLAGLIESAAT